MTHAYEAGGSTHHEDEPCIRPPARVARKRPAAGLFVAALVAGCQPFTAHETTDARVERSLVSPLASAVIGDPAVIVPLRTDTVPHRLPAPEIELDPVPAPRPANLVEQLRASFSLPDSTDAALVSELEYFARHRDYLERVLTRARPYLHYIAQELDARGMPADLALLPIVESAFDPFAYSHGRAAGLWQIIPATAKRLGVKQNWWFDGRRDLIQSTRGALDYLEILHRMFDEDWLLAVAGYNSGEGNVARALKRAAADGRGRDFWSIRSYLPRETRTYVPRLLAIRNLVANAEALGVPLPKVPNQPYLAVVDTGGQIDMALAAQLAGVSTDELYHLNSGINRWATDPDGPHQILVPIDNAERFAAAVAELPAGQRVSWTRHRIRQGETLGTIAAAYSTTPAVLRDVNGLRGNLIRSGDHLMIPHARAAYDDYALSADARLASTLNRERSGERTTHRVRRGDSLWSISQQYGVEVRSLAGWNGMAPGDTLAVGRELVVWVTESAAPVVLAAASGAANPFMPQQTRRVNYVVRRGDSLSSIAERFRVTLSELLEWNGAAVSTSRHLQPGDRLVMFVNVLEQST